MSHKKIHKLYDSHILSMNMILYNFNMSMHIDFVDKCMTIVKNNYLTIIVGP
jgi:hypothetical protein